MKCLERLKKTPMVADFSLPDLELYMELRIIILVLDTAKDEYSSYLLPLEEEKEEREEKVN